MHMMGTGNNNSSEDTQLVFRYQSFGRIFSFLGLVCLFTAMVSPHWVVVVGTRHTINVGLWTMCRYKNCRKYVGAAKILVVIKVLISLCALSGLVAVSCAFLSSLRKSKAPLFTNFFTGLLLLGTMLLYDLSLKPNNIFGSSVVVTDLPVYVSWSFILGCFACFLFLLNANVQGAKTLLVMAIFCGFVGASFMTFTYRYSESFEMYRYQVAAMGSFITAALVFLALSIYTIRISTHGVSRIGKITYQWSFYLAWTTCPCFILSGLFGLIAHQRLLIHGSSLTDGESTITTSSCTISSLASSSSSSEWTAASSNTVEEEGEEAQQDQEQEGGEGEEEGEEEEEEEEEEEKTKPLDQVIISKEAVLA
nr:uncharacterized protein LOC110086522 isoform X1 [Pogona vitticeps]